MDTLEIIRQLQADPALKAQLRAVLLSEEVLGLPERIERVDEQLEKLVQVAQSHDKRLQRLENQVGEIDGGCLYVNERSR